MQGIDFLFSIVVLIFSVVVHEVSHGYAADSLGDPTARHSGRLTLNPLKHVDAFGSVILPMLTYWAGGFIFGWAKPVPYNPHNLRYPRWGPAIVAAAGPAVNLLIAVFFGLVVRFGSMWELPSGFISIAAGIAFINTVLAIFNLVPIPPLDGSKVLFSALPASLTHVEDFLEQWGMAILLVFIVFFSHLLSPAIGAIFHLLTGVSF